MKKIILKVLEDIVMQTSVGTTCFLNLHSESTREMVANKLEKKLSVDGGFTSDKLEGEKGFDDLSMEEQESYLLKAATQLDDTM